MKSFYQLCQLYFIFLVFAQIGVYSWVEFYDAHYLGCERDCYFYKYDQPLDTSPGHCINLPEYVGNQTQEVRPNECIFLFQHLDCQGNYIVVEPLWWFRYFHLPIMNMQPTPSFASWSSFKHLVRYDLYRNPNYNGPLMAFTDVQICDCLNLPGTVAKEVSSLAVNGGCLRLHSDEDCKGRMIELTKDSLHHDNLQELRFDNEASSISLCEPLAPDCLKLSGVATTFRSMTNLEDLIQEKSLNKLELASTSIFINNGSSPISKTYEGRRSYKESCTFERVESLSEINTFSIGSSISVEEGAGVELGPFSAGAKAKTELSAAYQFQSQHGSQTRDQYSTEDSREFTVRETFTVHPCKIYHVNSFMLVGENLPVEYDLEIIITGENRYGRVSWGSDESIKNLLPPGLEYIRKLNDSSGGILVKARGTIVTNMGFKSEVAVNEEVVPGCGGWWDSYKWHLLLGGASILLLCIVVFLMAYLLIVRKRQGLGQGQGHHFANNDERQPLLSSGTGTGVININSD